MIQLRVLGGAVLQWGDTPVTSRAAQPHHLALMAFLAAAPGQTARRDKVIACLWPELGARQGRHRLSVALHILRRGLGDDALTTFGDAIALNPHGVWTDVGAFLTAVGDGRLEEAASRYAGPFLDGFFVSGSPEFDRWVESERERLAGVYRVTLARLIAEAEERKDLVAAADRWRQLAAHDPYSEQVAIGLMHALAAQGDLAGAVRHARAHATLVEAELELPPDPELLSLANRLAREAEARTVRGPGAAAPGSLLVETQLSRPDPSEPSPGGLQPPSRQPHQSLPRRRVALVVAGVLLLAAVLAARGRLQENAAGDTSVRAAVAVLPFTDRDGVPENRELGGHIAEQVGVFLAHVPGLRVRSATPGFEGRPARRASRILGVDQLVDGELQRQENRVLLTVRLLDGRTGRTRWTGSFDRPAADASVLQEELPFSIADTLRLRIAQYVPKVYTESRRAYDRFLRGVYSHKRYTPEDIWKALQFYREAYEEDPGFALSHAVAANAYIDLRSRGLAADVAFAKARDHVDQALALDSTLAEGNAALGYLRMWADRDFDAGAHLFQRTIMLYPTLPQARGWYGWYAFYVRGWHDAGLANLRRALEVDPLNIIRSRIVEWALYNARRYDEVQDQSRVTWSLDSDRARSMHDSPLAAAYRELGRFEESVTEYRALQERTGGVAPPGLAVTYARMGRVREAQAILREVEVRARNGQVAPWEVAPIHASLGEFDRAFEWLDRAYQTGTSLVFTFRTDPALAPLRDDPRFDQFLQRIGFARSLSLASSGTAPIVSAEAARLRPPG